MGSYLVCLSFLTSDEEMDTGCTFLSEIFTERFFRFYNVSNTVCNGARVATHTDFRANYFQNFHCRGSALSTESVGAFSISENAEFHYYTGSTLFPSDYFTFRW